MKDSAAFSVRVGSARVLSLLLQFGLTVGTALAGQYDAALATLSGQGPESAVSLLIEDRPLAANGASVRAWEQRRLQQKKAAEKLAAVAPELLLPLIDLHDRVQIELRRRGLDEAADQERTTVFVIADLLAGRVSEGDLGRILSDVFAVLAGDFHRRSPGPTAADLYRRSLRFDFRNPAATSGLALVLESNGQYRRALPYLELQFAFDPRREEAGLRRAVNLLRAGRVWEATLGLERLASEAETEWVAAIAVQELARVAMNAGDLEDAREIVEQGMVRLGQEPTLAMLALYLDERLAGGESVVMSGNRLSLEAGAVRSTSSRYRYSELSEDLLQAARQRIRSAAAAARPLLADYLEDKAR